MATLTVWKFADPDGAERAVETLTQLARRDLLKVHDAATVSWPAGKKKPKTTQLTNLAGPGALTGTFWGLLFGIIFFVPIIGMAVGAAAGAIAGSLSDVGIDDGFIARVRDEVQPGTSALFVLSSDAVIDEVVHAFQGQEMQLLYTSLSEDEELKLRETFLED
jgi:uncharacterized membrane protein